MIDEQTVTPPEPRPEDTTRESYAFVMNIRELVDIETYELAPGHFLRRAVPDEIAVIKDVVSQVAGGGANPLVEDFWEYQWPHAGGTFVPLPEREWRYFVISFAGFNDTIARLQAAMDLAPVELEIGFTMLRWGITPPHNARAWNPKRLFHVLEYAQRNDGFFKGVTSADLGTITQIHTNLAAHDAELIDVRRLARQVGELKGFPHTSPLRFLGYFAILESLLTHAPKPTDPYDSITRQVKKKIALLQHRWATATDYSAFGNAFHETIWSKMYVYRSQLAHGGSPTFDSELSVLVNHERALELLRETVKSTIRQALVEPRLLADLREC